MNVTKELFERNLAQIQASWRLEGQELQEDEKEQLRRFFMGEINKAEFDRWVIDRVKGKLIE